MRHSKLVKHIRISRREFSNKDLSRENPVKYLIDDFARAEDIGIRVRQQTNQFFTARSLAFPITSVGKTRDAQMLFFIFSTAAKAAISEPRNTRNTYSGESLLEANSTVH